MTKDDLVQEIGALLIRDPQISSKAWRHLAIVAQVAPNSTKVNGFSYQENGRALPTGPRNLRVLDKFEELRDAMHSPGRESWKACLLRIDNATNEISIDFEYDHPEKWQITPTTIQQMAESLRPDKPPPR